MLALKEGGRYLGYGGAQGTEPVDGVLVPVKEVRSLAGWAVLCVLQTPPGTNSCMEACWGLHVRHSKSVVQGVTAEHAIILNQNEKFTGRFLLLCSCLSKGSVQDRGLF